MWSLLVWECLLWGATRAALTSNEASPMDESYYNRAAVPVAGRHSQDEERCWAEGKVWFSGACQSLLVPNGPCPGDSWLVVERAGVDGVRPVCKKPLCKDGQALYKGECHTTDITHNPCTRRNTTLQVDWSGKGRCKCNANRAWLQGDNGACYLAYSQGPCSEGLAWVPDPTSARPSAPACLTDPCRRQRTDPHQVLLPPYCLPYETKGPCPEGMVLDADTVTFEVVCREALSIQAFLEPLTAKQCHLTDHKGNCRQGVSLQKKQRNFLQQLKASYEQAS